MDLFPLSLADGDLSEADVLFSSDDDLSSHSQDDVFSSPAPPILTRRASAVPMQIEKKKDWKEKVYSRSAPVRSYMQSAPVRNYMQSAPVKIPAPAKRAQGDEDMMKLPPHKIVARRHVHAMSYSMMELGAWRPLKGRDLLRLRNAIWQKTGYLD